MKRSLAEWSEQELLMLALPHENTDWKPYLSEILDAYENFVSVASAFQKVLLIAPDETHFKQRFAKFKNTEFFKCPTNDTWIRDFGAIDIWENNKLTSLDFTFNAWGGKFQSDLDNGVNLRLFSEHFKTNLQEIALILEGGSVEFNGEGVMLTTTKCLLNANRNAHLSKSELERHLKELFGLQSIIWLENGFIKGDDTDSHIHDIAAHDEFFEFFCDLAHKEFLLIVVSSAYGLLRGVRMTFRPCNRKYIIEKSCLHGKNAFLCKKTVEK